MKKISLILLLIHFLLAGTPVEAKRPKKSKNIYPQGHTYITEIANPSSTATMSFYSNGRGSTIVRGYYGNSLSLSFKWNKQNDVINVFFPEIGVKDSFKISLGGKKLITKGDEDMVFYLESIYSKPSTFPEFPGGQKALLNWLSQNIKYPDDALKNNIEGRVIVKFCVSKTGSISKVEIGESVYPSLDQEAIRVVSTMPKFIPGTDHGEVVEYHMHLPITFKLTTEN